MTVRNILAAAALLAAGASQAVPVAWTDWSNISGVGATGTMGGVSVTVVETGPNSINGPSQTGGTPGVNCTNYWTGTAYTQGTVSNGPTACEQVALNSAVEITVTFSQAVDNLYMALVSLGRTNLTVNYDYEDGPGGAFVVDSEGLGYWGDGSYSVSAGNVLEANEFHGVVRFLNPVTTLSFTATEENWHSFTFGSGPALPEPGSLALVGMALLGLGAAQRVARRRTASR